MSDEKLTTWLLNVSDQIIASDLEYSLSAGLMVGIIRDALMQGKVLELHRSMARWMEANLAGSPLGADFGEPTP